MKNAFAKFKRRSDLHTLIACCSLSLISAAFCVGMILLICKIVEVSLLYCLWGLFALLAGGIAFPFLYRSEREVAHRLDSALGYGEKVQTMLAFQKQSGILIDLQRQDTQERLSHAPVKSLRFERLWVYIAAALLALAMLITAVAIPQNRAQAYEPPHHVTEWENTALDELIEYVKGYDADENLKSGIVSELHSLIGLVRSGIPESQLPMFVRQTSGVIRNLVLTANDGADEAIRQKNSALGNEVIARLYAIFGLEAEGDPPDEEGRIPNEENPESPGSGGGGTGQITVGAKEWFFDPACGYAVYGDDNYGKLIIRYNGEMLQAFQDGIISEEEWYDFLREYFDYLYGINNEEGE